MNGSTQGRWARAITLAVTNATKLSGLVVALHEMLIRPTARPVAVAAAAFMMAGAQFSERAALAILDRLMGHAPEAKEDK